MTEAEDPLMNCEICGRPIRGPPIRIVVEGAKMLVCQDCSGLGEAGWEVEQPLKQRRPVAPKPIVRPSRRPRASGRLSEDLDIVEDYPQIVRKARENLGLSQEDLAKTIGEKLSLVKKIETGRAQPDHGVARKLEHALKVGLIVRLAEAAAPSTGPSKQDFELTLGDVVKVKKKDSKPEETPQRRP